MHMVLRFAPDLPDARVRFAPFLGDLVCEAGHGAPGFGVQTVTGIGEQPCRVDDPAVAVKLMLIGSAVAHPYRPAVCVPWPIVEGALRGRMLPVQREQHR